MNREPKSAPTARWKIITGTILLGVIFVTDSITRKDYNPAHLILGFLGGAFCFLGMCFIAGLAKNQTHWMRRNFGLIATIGGVITAALVLWSMLEKK